MLNFGVSTATVMVGLLLVGFPSVNAPVGGVDGTTAIYDSSPSVPAGLCDSPAGGGVALGAIDTELAGMHVTGPMTRVAGGVEMLRADRRGDT